MRYLAPLVSQLKDPKIPKPADPIETEIKDDKGKGILVVNNFEEMVLNSGSKTQINLGKQHTHYIT